jgi:predicted metalloprotease
MQWFGRRESSNVDDRRGMSGGGLAAGGGLLSVIIYFVYSFLSGNNVDPSQVPQLSPQTNQTTMDPQAKQEDDKRASFVKVVLADTEDIWAELLKKEGQTYSDPTLVLFRNHVASACGNASAASGPFYCPEDHEVYIDLAFYQDMQNKLNAPGEFAMAYVIAHEVGHHVQTILGTSQKVSQLRQSASEKEANRYSVMLELQADFYAGVWAHYEQVEKKVIAQGDIDEALNAAHAIGDDLLQKRATDTVVPDAFTHGTSAQRVYWFKKGYETGDIKQGDTFTASDL